MCPCGVNTLDIMVSMWASVMRYTEQSFFASAVYDNKLKDAQQTSMQPYARQYGPSHRAQFKRKKTSPSNLQGECDPPHMRFSRWGSVYVYCECFSNHCCQPPLRTPLSIYGQLVLLSLLLILPRMLGANRSSWRVVCGKLGILGWLFFGRSKQYALRIIRSPHLLHSQAVILRAENPNVNQ